MLRKLIVCTCEGWKLLNYSLLTCSCRYYYSKVLCDRTFIRLDTLQLQYYMFCKFGSELKIVSAILCYKIHRVSAIFALHHGLVSVLFCYSRLFAILYRTSEGSNAMIKIVVCSCKSCSSCNIVSNRIPFFSTVQLFHWFISLFFSWEKKNEKLDAGCFPVIMGVLENNVLT